MNHKDKGKQAQPKAQAHNLISISSASAGVFRHTKSTGKYQCWHHFPAPKNFSTQNLQNLPPYFALLVFFYPHSLCLFFPHSPRLLTMLPTYKMASRHNHKQEVCKVSTPLNSSPDSVWLCLECFVCPSSSKPEVREVDDATARKITCHWSKQHEGWAIGSWSYDINHQQPETIILRQ